MGDEDAKGVYRVSSGSNTNSNIGNRKQSLVVFRKNRASVLSYASATNSTTSASSSTSFSSGGSSSASVNTW